MPPTPYMPERIDAWNEALKGKSPEQILAWAAGAFAAGRIAMATSLGAEDQALTAMIATRVPQIEIFTLDTGRLFNETYDLLAETEKQFEIRIKTLFPETEQVAAMVTEHGINLFYESIENRKLCCKVRKIEPLQRELAGLDAWVVGLRAGQSVTREALLPVEWDAGNGLIKISPLAAWTEDQTWDYIKANDVPYHPLHDQGFPSIGCACCTRAIGAGEDVRAGRWWWEQPESKECGLHGRPGFKD